jgi:hypothetical protein
MLSAGRIAAFDPKSLEELARKLADAVPPGLAALRATSSRTSGRAASGLAARSRRTPGIRHQAASCASKGASKARETHRRAKDARPE